MKIVFLDPARNELDDAFDYYEHEQTGLGHRFVDEIVQSLKRISEYPESYQSISLYARRCLVNRFPYGIIYQIKETEILIVAIAHLHRKPDYWVSREE